MSSYAESTSSSPGEDEGSPSFLPYGRHCIEDDDIAAVMSALRGELLTTGPLVGRFEQALAALTGAHEAIACSSGTAALYMAARALGLGPGHTIIVPAITFAASGTTVAARTLPAMARVSATPTARTISVGALTAAGAGSVTTG